MFWYKSRVFTVECGLYLEQPWASVAFPFRHRRRTCDGYLPNSLRPISYLGFICFWPEIQSFFCKKTDQPWTRDSQCQDEYRSMTENTQNAPHISAQFVCPSPKVWDFWKKALSWCPSVPLGIRQKLGRMMSYIFLSNAAVEIPWILLKNNSVNSVDLDFSQIWHQVLQKDPQS